MYTEVCVLSGTVSLIKTYLPFFLPFLRKDLLPFFLFTYILFLIFKLFLQWLTLTDIRSDLLNRRIPYLTSNSLFNLSFPCLKFVQIG